MPSQISKTASHSTTKLHSYIDPYPTIRSARFGVDPDYHSGSRAKSVFSDSPTKVMFDQFILTFQFAHCTLY